MTFIQQILQGIFEGGKISHEEFTLLSQELLSDLCVICYIEGVILNITYGDVDTNEIFNIWMCLLSFLYAFVLKGQKH